MARIERSLTAGAARPFGLASSADRTVRADLAADVPDDVAEIGILHRDLDHRILIVTPRFCDLVGRTAAELEGLPLEALADPADAQPVARRYRRHLADAAPLRIETCRPGADGTPRWCELQVTFVRDDSGRIASTMTIALDITARRRTEQALRDIEEHHRNTVELAAQIKWTASAGGMIEEVSPRWTEVTGMSAADTRGIGWLHALHPEDTAPTIANWAVALDAKANVDVEYRVRTQDGGYRWFRSRAAARFDAAGAVVRWYGTLEDIDDRRRAEQSLRESEERFRLAAQATSLGIWDYDVVNDRREWSAEFKDMLGLPADTVPDVATALALVVADDRPQLEALIRAVHIGDGDHRFDVTLRVCRADTGDERCIRTSGWRIEAPGGHLERILVTIRDVTEEHTAEQRIRWAATHDALTRLPNRAHFSAEFEAAIARAKAEGTTLALILFDVDNLKITNDTIGHDAGDVLLVTFARRLARRLGSGTFLSRLGGDEFAAFVAVEDTAQTVARITATLDGLRDPFDYDGGTLNCQATAGVSFFPMDGGSAPDLLKAADMALYFGKAGLRGALAPFRPEMRANIQRRESMLAVARTAARDDRIVPFYQPKIALADGRLVGFEALLRWHHDTQGIQAPATIAAAFEDLTLATILGERMLDRICDDVARWLGEGLDVGTIAFNLSPAEFGRDGLFDRVLEHLHRRAIPPTMLELEVTETVFLGRGAEAVGTTLNAFHREGVRIALDDFGTGYASLTHLQAFPVDVIKIDRSFVANVAAGAGDAAIVDAVIGLARRLGMDVVAEGIETRAQADYLAAHGCTYGQGYLFGKAICAADVEAQVRAAISPA